MLPKGSISRVYEYYLTTPQFRNDMVRALQEFFDQPDLDQGSSLATTPESEAFFNEWFLYDFEFKHGQSVLKNFVATNPLGLTNKNMKLYKKLLNNKYSVFEVLEVKIGQSIKLKDLQTNKQWLVEERKATFSLKGGSVFFGRVGEVDDHYELIGADSFSLSDPSSIVKKCFHDLPLKLTPKLAHKILLETNTKERSSDEYSA